MDTKAIEQILKDVQAELPSLKTKENMSICLSCIDLTTLNPTDTMQKGEAFAQKVNEFAAKFPGLPNVAAICVYPALVPAVRKALKAPGVKIAAVGAGFPASQTFPEIKTEECKLCVERGADEVDIVISLNHFLAGEYEAVGKEISDIKAALNGASLKVILESGTLADPQKIEKASQIAIAAGADKIKTSTGKSEPAATPQAAIVMCQCILEHYRKTGRRIGFKPAGGISTTDEVLLYFGIVKHILGPEWLNNSLFRIGASRLANNLLSDILEIKLAYF